MKRGERERKKEPHKKRKSFLKRTICKTRSLKPDYRATITQSLMFIPVIRCEEEDLYFIVVECIQCCLVSASPSACLFGKHFPPPEARCNPRIEEKAAEMPSANC